MVHASKRRLGQGSASRQAVLIVLLAVCSVVAARVLSPAADGWTRPALWDRPDIVGDVAAVDSQSETELRPLVVQAQSKGAVAPPANQRVDPVRPQDRSARTGPVGTSPGGGVGSIGFLGLLVIVVVAVVLFHLLGSQDRDRR